MTNSTKDQIFKDLLIGGDAFLEVSSSGTISRVDPSTVQLSDEQPLSTPAVNALPCPYCGNADLIVDRTYDVVECTNCGALGPDKDKILIGPRNSVDAWNARD